MRVPKRANRWRLAALLLAAAGPVAALDTSNYYFHDAELLKQLQTASAGFTPASQEQLSLVLLRNLDAASAREREITSKTARIVLQGHLSQLEKLSWRRIEACSKYSECRPSRNESCSAKIEANDPAANNAERIGQIAVAIAATAADIAKLSQLIETDPDGNAAGVPVIQADTQDALQRLNAALKAITDAVKKDLAIPAESVLALNARQEELLQKADQAVAAAHAGNTAEGKALGRLLDMLYKSKDLDLLVDQKSKELVTKAGATPLSDDMKALLAKYTQAKSATVGEFVTWLATDDASITKIRLELAADMRKSVVELRNAQLSEKKAALVLQQKRLALYTAQLGREQELRGPDYSTRVYQDCAYGGLLQLQARLRASSGAGTAVGEQVAKDRDAIANYMSYLSYYVERIGYLDEQERLLDQEAGVQVHRNSILHSQAASRARDRMVRRGLDGLVSFAEGGVSYDDVNGIVQLLQTALLGVIANK